VTEYDQSMYLRPSRYAEADKFYGFAATEFGSDGDSATLLEHVSSWVGTRLNYMPGSSDTIDGAVDTLLAGEGVCRDYAHLVVALLRAVNVPARLVSVYAPGVYPMDFHAVAEAFVKGQWRVVDATCLAPRQTMVRIATGRDASDTAFLDNHKGTITLNSSVVTAVVDGDLPRDSIDQLVSIR
jgi:transglutaminase-like putative cysteine protease